MTKPCGTSGKVQGFRTDSDPIIALREQAIKAILATLRDDSRVLIVTPAGQFVAISVCVIATSGPRWSGAEVSALIEGGLGQPALRAIEERPGEVLAWITWCATSERVRHSPRRVRGLNARRGGIYVE